MKITDYSFGRITIDGKTYSKDVIIYPDHVYSPWWRKEGHLLQNEDLSDIVNAKLPVLIVGTGYYGAMKVSNQILDYLNSNSIEAIVEKTPEAVIRYNEYAATGPVIAAFHLTC